MKLGFDLHWVKLMKECIWSVQYMVLINGQPRGLIVPLRGLRQGDHLSPYLFILCTEALIANIKKGREKSTINRDEGSKSLSGDITLAFCE